MREIIIGLIIGVIAAIVLLSLGANGTVSIMGAGVAAVVIGSLVRRK